MKKEQLLNKKLPELKEIAKNCGLEIGGVSKDPYIDGIVAYFEANPLPGQESQENVSRGENEYTDTNVDEGVIDVEGGKKGKRYKHSDLGTDVFWYKKMEIVPSPFEPNKPYKRTLKVVSLHLDDLDVLNHIDDPRNKRIIYEKLY